MANCFRDISKGSEPIIALYKFARSVVLIPISKRLREWWILTAACVLFLCINVSAWGLTLRDRHTESSALLMDRRVEEPPRRPQPTLSLRIVLGNGALRGMIGARKRELETKRPLVRRGIRTLSEVACMAVLVKLFWPFEFPWAT